MTKLKNTVADRIKYEKANSDRLSSEYSKSIKDLISDMTTLREEMKSLKISLLAIFDATEKLKQSHKTIMRENEQMTQDIESTNDEVNSLKNSLKKTNKETEMINRDVIKEGEELAMSKEKEKQTAQNNDEAIQFKRILTTSIVLARKEIGRIMNEVHGLVSKRAAVREDLDILIKTYDY